MKWLGIVFALVACSDKQTKVPSIDSIDRSCKADADCTLAVGTCCTGCGGQIGDPVNAAAWAKTADARNAQCAKQRCPEYDCEKLPDCRDEGVAICKAGVCGLEMRKTAACAAMTADAGATLADDECASDADCTLYTFRDCCDGCSGPAMTKQAAAKKLVEDAKACVNSTANCPIVDCKSIPPVCVDKKCVSK